MFLKLLLNSSLTIIIAATFLTDDPIIKISQKRSNMYPNILAHQYDIIITHIEKNILVSNCSIHINILSPISSIILYSPVIYNITLFHYPQYNSKNGNGKLIPYKLIQTFYDETYNGSVEYMFTNDLSPGYYIIKLVTNITEDTGLKNFYKRDERQWLATYVDTIGIQRMIPRLNLLTAKSLPIWPFYNIIIKRHQNYTVLSNMPILTVEINDKNMTHFNTFVRPNYFVFVDNRANLSLIPDRSESKVKVDMWCRMRYAFAHEIVKNITLYLFDKWKRLNQTWRINHVAIPDFPENESIINLGLAIYREADVTYIENVDSVANKIKVAHFIAHKVVQECLYYENPLWLLSSSLNEAIVAFLELYITDKVLPNNRVIDLFVVQFEQDSHHLNTEYNTSLHNTSFSAIENPLYIKRSGVFRSLQQMAAKQIFWKSIRKYIRDNKPVDHFFAKYMENPSTQKFANNLHVIWIIIKSWKVVLLQKYYPVLKITRDYSSGQELIQVSTHNLNNLKKLAKYYIPITYTTQHFIGISYQISLNYFLQSGFHSIAKDGWILFNIKQTGYYRVNYDIENWRRIASYLNSKHYTKIHVLNRAQIIDDAFHLMITNQLNSTIFWNIATYLSRETDYIAWYPMFKALEYLSNIFLFQEPIYFNIRTKIRNLLYNLLDKLKYNEVSNEHDLKKSLRMEAMKWTCNLDGRICIEKAQHILNRHLDDPESNTLLPWWKEWTYCQGLKILYYSLSFEASPLSYEYSPWWKVYRLGKEKFKTKLLKYLSCPQESQFIKAYLNLIKNDSTTSIMFFKDFSDKDYINYFLFTIAKHARNPIVLDFILKKLKNIRPRQISEYATLTVIINHVNSPNQLDKIKIFLKHKFINVTQIELNECKKLWYFVKERNTKVKNVLMLQYPKTSNLTQSAEHSTCMQQYISNIENKIQMRIFEIERQQNYFQNFVKYPELKTLSQKSEMLRKLSFWSKLWKRWKTVHFCALHSNIFRTSYPCRS